MRYLTIPFALVVSLACAADALAQGSGSGRATDPTPTPTQGTTPTPTPTPKAGVPDIKFETRRQVEVGLRFFGGMIPLGTAFDPTTDDYSDLFDTGQGFGLTAVFLENKYRADNNRVTAGYGLFLNIDRFMFAGSTHTFASNNILRPDDLEMTSIVVGGRLDLPSGDINAPVRFVGGIDIGIGFALIDSLDVVFDQSPNSGPIGKEGFYDSTMSVIFEATFRLGIAIRAGDKAEINVQALIGYNFLTAPDNADDPAGALAPADADLMFNLNWGLQVSVAILIPDPEEGP